MRAASRKRTDTCDLACVACRTRKTRCSVQPGNTSCSHCIRLNKTCVFSDPPSRTPLTRKNLDHLEKRCRSLEAQLATLTRDATPTPAAPTQSTLSESIASENSDVVASNHQDHDAHGPFGQFETSFDWSERQTMPDGDTQHTADGMASLTLRDRKRGYLGNSSGSSLLEKLTSTLPRHEWKASHPHAHNPGMHMQRLALSHGMSSSIVRESLIEAYFRCYNPSYPILHQQSFRRVCSKRSSISPNSTWHITYFMVLAIGEWVSGFNEDSMSMYYDAARSRLNMDIMEAGTMNTVQALLLLSNYLQKTDRPNTAYNFLGMAYRVALGLGLHREITMEQAPETCALQQRRLIFWTLYSFDSGFSLTTGRPIMVSDDFIDTKKPLNIDDSESKPESALPAEVPYPTRSAAMAAQCCVAVIANRIHSTFQSVNGILDLEQATQVMVQALKDWKKNLPAYFTASEVPEWFLGPRAMVLWKSSNINLVLLVASQRCLADAHSYREMSKKICQFASELAIEICNFCEQHKALLHHGLTWYIVYYLLQCLLAIEAQRIHVEDKLPLLETNRLLPDALRETVNRAHNCLMELSLTNKPADRVCQLLDHLSNKRCPTNQNIVAGSNGSLISNQATENAVTFDSLRQDNMNELHGHLPDSSMTNSNDLPQYPLGSSIPGESCMMAADPSLHMFMDGSNDLWDIFGHLGGFPSANDGNNFSYDVRNHAL
ncbi:hypothetical protein P171DRAFT_448473 [Karstenula rhodostoma CBS 690.94]|uniref:Zn(2)-C6 fungal-type domain-containing protein n=1 Tax=Karstenula rhodostoma CBS 690.94 TaxID=1392251 RepID=A0A9P4U6B6_9PLEO|nr:hypothetical protein P171DRAFT_448473 [Karstenula rhodostoma CBS 690.94]